MNGSVVSAGLLTVAAAGTVGLVVWQWAVPSEAPSAAQVCAAAAEVLGAMGESVSDQVVLRARAAGLADILIDRSAQEQDAGSLATASRLVAVLDDADATVSDLAEVVEPVAQQCPDLRSAS